MTCRLKRGLIRLYGVLTAGTGLLAIFFFFPSSRGCSDLWACLLYTLCGLVLLALGTGIVLLREMARKFMLLFSFLFSLFFVYQTIWLLNNDQTGQGLAGMVLLGPIVITCFIGFPLLIPSTMGSEFKHPSSLTGKT